MTAICSAPNCGRAPYANGRCLAHYMREWRGRNRAAALAAADAPTPQREIQPRSCGCPPSLVVEHRTTAGHVGWECSRCGRRWARVTTSQRVAS